MTKTLLEIYHAAIGAVEGRAAVRQRLQKIEPHGPLTMIAIGKAAASMA